MIAIFLYCEKYKKYHHNYDKVFNINILHFIKNMTFQWKSVFYALDFIDCKRMKMWSFDE